jgi:hypothetical protein
MNVVKKVPESFSKTLWKSSYVHGVIAQRHFVNYKRSPIINVLFLSEKSNGSDDFFGWLSQRLKKRKT